MLNVRTYPGAILKKTVVFGVAAGWLKEGANGDSFFSFLQKKIFFQKWSIFSYQTKKKKKLK